MHINIHGHAHIQTCNTHIQIILMSCDGGDVLMLVMVKMMLMMTVMTTMIVMRMVMLLLMLNGVVGPGDLGNIPRRLRHQHGACACVCVRVRVGVWACVSMYVQENMRLHVCQCL